MQEISDKLIVALDVDTLEEAKRFVGILYPTVKLFKIGSQLFTACGPEAVKMVAEKGGKVFLDLKFYDIPRTVYAAVTSGTGLSTSAEPTIFPVFMMTVHIKGGIDMLKKAVEGASQKAGELKIKKPLVVGVTELTSQEASEKDIVDAARIAKEAGLDGVVCSTLEARKVREEFGKNFIIVTPGIRPKGSSADDQKRTATAQEAIEAGADYIVVGRPILEASNPLLAAQEIRRELCPKR